MKHLKRIIYKIRIKLLHLCNSIRILFVKGEKVNIVSSQKYKNHKENLVLQKYFLKNKYTCKIISWEDNKLSGNNIIRSVWGYHNNSEKFIDSIKDSNLINPLSIILDNMDKKKQIEILKENNIDIIDTKFISDISKLTSINDKVVVKPVISAGGNNTYIINGLEDLKKCNGITNLMVQPYLEGIENGEISVIVIGKEILYGILRYPGVFTQYQKEKYIPINELDSSIINTSNKIINIDKYNDCAIMRIDFVKEKDKYLVMEVEMVDPDLFIEAIPDNNLKNKVYQKIVDTSINIFGIRK